MGQQANRIAKYNELLAMCNELLTSLSQTVWARATHPSPPSASGLSGLPSAVYLKASLLSLATRILHLYSHFFHFRRLAGSPNSALCILGPILAAL